MYCPLQKAVPGLLPLQRAHQKLLVIAAVAQRHKVYINASSDTVCVMISRVSHAAEPVLIPAVDSARVAMRTGERDARKICITHQRH